MRTRIITGAIMLGVLLPLIIIQNAFCEIAFLVVVVVLSAIGTYEYMSVAYRKSEALKLYRVIVPICSGILALLACNATNEAAVSGDYIAHLYALMFYVFGVVVILGMMIFTKDSTANDIASCILAFTYGGLLLGYAFSLRYFAPQNMNDTFINLSGWKSFLFVYSIVLITDTFAYLIGCKWGHHRLCPTISPKKSVEGAIAGLVFGLLFGVCSLYLYQIVKTSDHILWVILGGIVLCGIISCATQLGDLIESKLKRSFEVKDFGKILPGHGGILDRFDSFIYAGVVFYLIAMLIEIVILG